MRILWWSNAPWANTGYGTQTAQVTARLQAAGHEVAIAANYGLEAARTNWRGMPVLPKGMAEHSQDTILSNGAAWIGDKPGYIVTLYDVWPLLSVPGHEQANIASWTPVDRYPVPPQVRDWARQHFTIAMSRFGQKALADVGIAARYVPHAIETGVFAPTMDTTVRPRLGIPDDAFVVMINAANKGGTPVRKAWSEMLSAYQLFAKDKPDTYLYLNTHLDGMSGAPRLVHLIDALGINIDRLRIVDQYDYLAGRVSDTHLADLYGASDVLLATAMGEGFGIPVIEAQACGTPVIVTDFSAQPELVGAGWKVGYQPWWDHFQAGWAATPLVNEIRKALNEAYDRRGDEQLRSDARAFAVQYDVDTVFETYWVPVLAEMADSLKPKVPRKVRRKRR